MSSELSSLLVQGMLGEPAGAVEQLEMGKGPPK